MSPLESKLQNATPDDRAAGYKFIVQHRQLATAVNTLYLRYSTRLVSLDFYRYDASSMTLQLGGEYATGHRSVDRVDANIPFQWSTLGRADQFMSPEQLRVLARRIYETDADVTRNDRELTLKGTAAIAANRK